MTTAPNCRASWTAAAPTAPPPPPSLAQCRLAAGGVTARLRACDAAELTRRDAELNRTYAELLRALPPARRERLRAAERAWVAFRDAECAFRASATEGGTATPLVAGACLLELTGERVDRLRTLLGGRQAGRELPGHLLEVLHCGRRFLPQRRGDLQIAGRGLDRPLPLLQLLLQRLRALPEPLDRLAP